MPDQSLFFLADIWISYGGKWKLKVYFLRSTGGLNLTQRYVQGDDNFFTTNSLKEISIL